MLTAPRPCADGTCEAVFGLDRQGNLRRCRRPAAWTNGTMRLCQGCHGRLERTGEVLTPGPVLQAVKVGT
jgi:hypothetical protein